MLVKILKVNVEPLSYKDYICNYLSGPNIATIFYFILWNYNELSIY